MGAGCRADPGFFVLFLRERISFMQIAQTPNPSNNLLHNTTH